MTLDADGAAPNVGAEPEYTWDSVSKAGASVVVGTIANEFDMNGSDRDPRKSTSALFELAGAADKRKRMSFL